MEFNFERDMDVLNSILNDLKEEVTKQVKSKKYDKDEIANLLSKIDDQFINREEIKEAMVSGDKATCDTINKMINFFVTKSKAEIDYLASRFKSEGDNIKKVYSEKITESDTVKVKEELSKEENYQRDSFDDRYDAAEKEKNEKELLLKKYKEYEKIKASNNTYNLSSDVKEINKKIENYLKEINRLNNIKDVNAYKNHIRYLKAEVAINDENAELSQEFKERVEELKNNLTYLNIDSLRITQEQLEKLNTYSDVKKLLDELKEEDFEKIGDKKDKIQEENDKISKEIAECKVFEIFQDEKKEIEEVLKTGTTITPLYAARKISTVFEDISKYAEKMEKLDLVKLESELFRSRSKLEKMQDEKDKRDTLSKEKAGYEATLAKDTTKLDLRKFGLEENDTVLEDDDGNKIDFSKISDDNDIEKITDILFERMIEKEGAMEIADTNYPTVIKNENLGFFKTIVRAFQNLGRKALRRPSVEYEKQQEQKELNIKKSLQLKLKENITNISEEKEKADNELSDKGKWILSDKDKELFDRNVRRIIVDKKGEVDKNTIKKEAEKKANEEYYK